MSRLNELEQIVNNTVSHYSHVKIMPRGLPRFADSLLRGTVRFAKRSGNTVALLNPDNTFEFASAPQTRDDKFTLLYPNIWITPDCILSMGPERELQQVYDVVDQTILLQNNLTGTYTTSNKVLLHSYPMLLFADVSSGATTITVKSYYKIANGDVFSYLQDSTLLQSLTEINITNAVYQGTVGSGFYNLLYSITLEKGIEKSFPANTMVYFRAYPAYFSTSIRVPNSLFSSEPLGPFLVDLLTGRLLEGQEFDETFSLRTISRSGNYTLGDATSYVPINKNYLILDRSVPVHAPLFWELAEGSMRITPSKIVLKVSSTLSFDNTSLIPYQYNVVDGVGVVQYLGSVNLLNVRVNDIFSDGSGTEYTVADIDVTYNNISILTLGGSVPGAISTTVVDHLTGSIRVVGDNKFCAGIKCIPHLSTNHSWQVSLLTNQDCSIRFIFYPNDPQEFYLIANITQSITVTIPVGEEVTDMEINITSLANNCEVRMSEWSPKQTVEQVEYSFVVKATGIATYQASGLIIKPYFMSSEFLKMNYDSGINYDSGKVYF